MEKVEPDYDAIFSKPSAPRSDWETFKWALFEHELLSTCTDLWNRKEAAFLFSRIYIKYILLFSIIFYLLFFTATISFDLPHAFPSFYRVPQQNWNNSINIFYKLSLFYKTLFVPLCVLASIYLGGLILSFLKNIDLAIALSFLFSVTMVTYPILSNHGLLILFSLFVGLNFFSSLNVGCGCVLSLIGCVLMYQSTSIWKSFLAFFIGAMLFQIWLTLFTKKTLINNPLLFMEGKIIADNSDVISKLKKETKEFPEVALKFASFLRKYRHQDASNLAYQIEHLATSIIWHRNAHLDYNSFYIPPFTTFADLDIEKRRFRKKEEIDNYLPSEEWQLKIASFKEAVLNAETQIAIVLRKQGFEHCRVLLESFEDTHTREAFKSRDVYFPVIEQWKKVLTDRIQELSQAVERIQSVSLNPYSKGQVLTPDRTTNSGLFLERDDLKAELSLKIQTSAVMPTFLILGQRRTGKTSLLNFLPQMLDRSHYLVAVIDAQGMSGELSVPRWLAAWRDRVRSKLSPSPAPEPLPEDWLAAWDAFSEYILGQATGTGRKIILCMEEYDETHGFHNALRTNPAVAAQLLARIRAFTQRQNDVILMFVGATEFIDLPGEPNWSKYFVQVHTFWVEYLSRSASLKLISEPVPNFRLKYAEGLPERIWELTQGHPHLLHSICSDLVDLANAVPKNPVDEGDLDKILREKTLRRPEQPFNVFWAEFCQAEPMKKAVIEIAHRQPVDQSLSEVRRLMDYKYVVKSEDGELRMRVPLFEEWLLLFGY